MLNRHYLYHYYHLGVMDDKGLFYLSLTSLILQSMTSDRGNAKIRSRLCIVNMATHPMSEKIRFEAGGGLRHASIVKRFKKT